MSGHSKWKNIQHRKGAQDAHRGKVFTKIATEITVAVRGSGPDPDANPRLRLALTKARQANMPRDNIERAIKRGSGGADGVVFSEKTYEGYGPGGVAILVFCLTENVNRTVGEVRHAFTRFGGNLGADGSVGWKFKKQGLFIYDRTKITDHDQLLETALDAGALDVIEEEDSYEVICRWEDFPTVKTGLDKLGSEPGFAEVTMLPDNMTKIEPRQTETLQKLLDTLEDNDDVQNVYHNADL